MQYCDFHISSDYIKLCSFPMHMGDFAVYFGQVDQILTGMGHTTEMYVMYVHRKG